MTVIKISTLAYAKAIFHACKYPSQPVNGVLTGFYEKKKDVLVITDCFPLFHSIYQISLLPSQELALMQIDTVLEEEGKSQKIVGYYFANEVLQDNSFGLIHKTIAGKLASLCESEKSFCSLLLVNERLNPEEPEFAAQIYQLSESKDWYLTSKGKASSKKKEEVSEQSGEERPKENAATYGASFVELPATYSSSEDIPETLESAVYDKLKEKLVKGVFQSIVDFELHLETITKDYRNKHITF